MQDQDQTSQVQSLPIRAEINCVRGCGFAIPESIPEQRRTLLSKGPNGEQRPHCPCGLLLVSHDAYFLSRLTKTRWQIRRQNEESSHTAMTLRVVDVDTPRAIG